MSIASEPKHCPKCQAPLPGDAPQGLCPKCLLAAASVPTEAGQPAPDKTPPGLAELAAAFPQLEILELIGQGGMGFVFKARQPKLDRFVALKILPQSLAADPAFAERFSREGRVLAKLNHPNIVTIHDFGQASGFFYLLMEFVDGVNLRQAMQAGRFTPAQALAIVPKICEALQFAHNEGILHRDIKPENILLDSKGRVKIADFGIAKLVGDVGQAFQPAGAGDFPVARSETGNTGLGSPVNPQAGKPALQPDALTEAGKALGTPNYMAPEQRECSGEVDHRADIYSLGVVFYEMLTGELPLGRFAPPSEKSAADPRVDEVVLRALEKEKTRRYASAEEVKTMVETIMATPDASKRRGDEPQTESERQKAESGKPDENLVPSTATELNPWQPVIALLGMIGCLILFIIGFILPFPANLILLVIAPIVFIVAGLKLAGFWPWPSPLFPQSSWTGRNLSRNKPPGVTVALPAMEVNPWQPVMALLGIVFGTVAFIIGFILPFPANLMLLVIAPIGIFVAGLKLAGFWPWPSPLFPRSNWTGRNLPSVKKKNSPPGNNRPDEAQTEKTEIGNRKSEIVPRFSRTAIVGACWMPFFFIAFILMFSVRHVSTGEYHGPEWWQYLLMFTLLPLGITTPFGTTILGWVAVSQIRRSAGKLYGLWLAVFDGLLFPLLALDALIFCIGWFAGGQLIPDAFGDTVVAGYKTGLFVAIWVGGATLLSGIADYFIIRRVWRAVNKPNNTSGSTPSKTQGGRVVIICLAAVMTVVALAAGLPPHFLVPVVVLCLLAIVVASIGTVARAAEPVAGARITADAWIVIAVALVISGGLLTAALIQKSRGSAPYAHADAQNLSFGPMVERIITVGNDAHSFYSFDRGDYAPGPTDFDPADEKNKDALWKWLTANHVDVFARTRDGRPVLVRSEMAATDLNEDDSDRLSPAMLDENPTWKSLLNGQVRPQESSTVGRGKLRGSKDTLVFQNRYEVTGLLQVVAVTSDPPGVKIRYKLVQNATTASAGPEASHGGKPDYAQAAAAAGAIEELGKPLSLALEKGDQAAALKTSGLFLEQLHLLDAQVRGTELELPANAVSLVTQMHEALQAGDMKLGKSLHDAGRSAFRAFQSTVPGGNFEERLLKLAAQQRDATQPRPATNSLSFGPVIEREIRGDGTNLWALNLASGNVVAKSARQSFKSADDEASLRAAGADLYQSVWANAPTAIKTLDMRLCVGLYPQAGDTNHLTLENLTEEQLRQALATMENWRADMEAASVPGLGLDLRRATSNIAGTNLYLFITSDGVKGALQISLKETSPAMLRYKLVQNKVSPSARANSAAATSTEDQ